MAKQQWIYNLLPSFGKTIHGLNCFALSKSMIAYEMITTISPGIPLLAAGPLRQTIPEPLCLL